MAVDPMPTQKGAKSGWIIQKAPWIDQKRKNTTKRWWVYQKRSKLARRAFSYAVKAMAINAVNMIYPVHPGPLTKLASKNPPNPRLFFAEIWAKLFQWAIVCTQEKNTMDQPVNLWKVMFLSNGMIPFSGVCLAIEISVRHTGNRINATSKCSVRAAARAIGYVRPNVLLAVDKLSFNW